MEPPADWPTGKYRVILADPPWAYDDAGCQGGVGAQYSTLDEAGLKALPVAELAEKDCILFLWTTYPKLPEGLALMKAWGFSFRTVAFTWIKADTRRGVFFGLGRWTRGNVEICLLGKRGKPSRQNADVEQLIVAPLRQHSRKPDVIHERIERLVEGPYCELFARCARPGWMCWGNQVGKFTSSLDLPIELDAA